MVLQLTKYNNGYTVSLKVAIPCLRNRAAMDSNITIRQLILLFIVIWGYHVIVNFDRTLFNEKCRNRICSPRSQTNHLFHRTGLPICRRIIVCRECYTKSVSEQNNPHIRNLKVGQGTNYTKDTQYKLQGVK